MVNPQVGFQPRTTPAERRADLDLKRRVVNGTDALRDELLQAVSDLRDEVYYTRRFRAFWQYSNTATPPPGAGQLRTNTPTITEMYVHKNDADGYDRSTQLDFIPHGALIRVRGTSGSVFELRSTGPAVDNGVWYTVPVTVISGTDGDKGFRIELTMFSGIWSEDLPT
jgi:hypothetical protein